MLQKILLCVALTGSTMAFTQSTLAPNAPEDKPVSFSSMEQHKKLLIAIGPYVEQARKTWATAKANFLKGLPPQNVFFVTTELLDSHSKREIVFIEVQKIENGMITGLIANNITTVIGFKAGQSYTLAENELLDWTISKPDGSEEGNVVGKFLDTYTPQVEVIAPPDKMQLTWLENRGRELAKKVQIENYAKIFLEKQGIKTKGISSPIITQDGGRWLIFYENNFNSPYEISRVLECQIADFDTMRIAQGISLPKAIEAMAGFQLSFKKQLEKMAADFYEIPVSDGDLNYSLYIFPRQADPNEIIIGKDMKSSFIANAEKPYMNTTFHQAIHKVKPKDLEKQLPPGASEPGWGHNHANSDYPPETDVALAILFPKVRWHILGKKWHFLINPDGGIQQLPMPEPNASSGKN